MAENAFAPMFGLGDPNEVYARYFIGSSYLNPLTSAAECGVGLSNVTFEPGCRNNWHVHHADRGGGADPHLHRRSRLVPGVGQGSSGAHAGHRRGYPRRREALARRRARQLVLPHRLRGTGRELLERVARARHGRAVPRVNTPTSAYRLGHRVSGCHALLVSYLL